MYTYIYIYSSV